MGATASKGTQVRFRTKGSTEAYVTLANLLSLSGPDATAEEIDVTDLGTTGNFRQFLAGFNDPGSITASISWTPADVGHGTTGFDIPGFFTNGTSGDWKILLGGSTLSQITFNGAVTQFSPSFDVASQITADFTIRLSGAPTFPSS